MTIRHLDRAPIILAYVADNQGCGHHRMLRPMEIMSRHGIAAGRAEMNMLSDEHVLALDPDVIVFQRQYEDAQRAYIERLRTMLPKAFFVFEIDDNFGAVPDWSWHKAFLSRDVDAKISKALALMDAISTTTPALAEHLRKLAIAGGVKNPDIRIIPNMLGREDFETASQIRASIRQPRENFRIGWGGGIGHAGDLAFLDHAIRTLEGVRWVFIGAQPDNIPQDIRDSGRIEFHPGVVPTQYLPGLAALDLDLMVAPLEDNEFNRSKSNLRLIEGGACHHSVIASPSESYKANKPPVFAYADSPEEWTAAISKFMALPLVDRMRHGQAMHDWAFSNYNMDAKVVDRLQAWLPKDVKAFQPKGRRANQGRIAIIAGADPSDAVKAMGRCFETLDEAIKKGSGDILYIRPGTLVPGDLLDRLEAMQIGENIASISFMTNDAAPQGFPNKNALSPMDPIGAGLLDKVAATMSGLPTPTMPTCAGPVLFLRREAIDAFGPPEIRPMTPAAADGKPRTNGLITETITGGTMTTDSGADITATELAVMEWGAMVTARGWRNVLFPGAYVVADRAPTPNPQDFRQIGMRIALRWPSNQMSDEMLDEFRETLEIGFHRDHFKSVPPEDPTNYSLWAYVYDTPSKKDMELAAKMVSGLPDRPAILAVNSIEELEVAINDPAIDWIVHVAKGGIVAKHAMAIVVDAINRNPHADVFYADHDHLKDGGRIAPDFKPNFDHHLLLGRDYVTQFCVIKRTIAAEIVSRETSRGTHAGETLDARVYGLVLGSIESTIDDDQERSLYPQIGVFHIPRVLTHLPLDENIASTKEISADKARLAMEHAKRIGWSINITPLGDVNVWREISYLPPAKKKPKVSIIIPTVSNVGMIEPCINTLMAKTTYPNFEVLVIQNGGSFPEMDAYLEEISARYKNVSWMKVPKCPFNWSEINNIGAIHTHSEMLVFLNDDTRVLEPTWLDEMVGAACVPGVGTVGARLLYPMDQIQHIGVICDKGATGHMHKQMPVSQPGYHGIAILSHEATAVTGACMLVKRSIWNELGRLNEEYAHNFNDVVFCLEARRHGYVNVVAAKAALQHLEGVTRTSPMTPEGHKIQTDEGQKLGREYPEADPYWNQNLAFFLIHDNRFVAGGGMELFKWPPTSFPWRETVSEPETASSFIETAIGAPVARRSSILLFGPKEALAEEVRNGEIIYEMAHVGGTTMKVMRPTMENLRPFDLRNAQDAARRLHILGVGKVIISGIGSIDPAHLMFFTKLGIPVEYRPLDAEAVCPKHNLDPKNDGNGCGKGWQIGACQGCVDTNGSDHGYVTMMAWYASWLRFLQNEAVTADMSELASPDYGMAIEDVLTLIGSAAQAKEAAE